MGKRKSSFDKKQAAKKRSSAPKSSNPFLVAWTSENAASSSSPSDAVLDHLIQITDLSRQKDESHIQTLYSHVDFLLEFLQTSDPISTSDLVVAKADVSLALLPWTIRGILSDTPEAKPYHWKTMSTSLSVLFSEISIECSNVGSSSSAADGLRTTLTQSTLNKLVPVAGRMATKPSSAISVDIRKNAESCYCLLLEHLYRPTLDLVCQSLLPFIVSDDVSTAMKTCTLQLMLSRLEKANAKNSFQLLLEPKVWNQICQLHRSMKNIDHASSTLLQSILSNGFFHIEHHLPGYRSLTTLEIPKLFKEDVKMNEDSSDKENSLNISKFRVYQSRLLEVLQESSSMSSASLGVSERANTARIIPLLVQCYLEQCKRSDEAKDQHKRGGGRAKKQKDAEFTFRLVASFIAPLLLVDKASCGDLRNVRLEALRDCLLVLLQFDVYLPSNEDKNGEQFTFLCDIGTLVLGDTQTDMNQSATSTEELLAVEALLRLNHLIFHERLKKLFAFLIKAEIDFMLSPEYSMLFSTIIRIYQQLRQLDHFFRALMQSINDLTMEEQKQRAMVSFFVESHSFAQDLGRAVRDCPIFQLEQMIQDLDEWISNKCSSMSDESATNKNQLLSLVVHFFSILSQNSRVEKSTYKSLKSKTENVMENSVRLLLEKDDLEATDGSFLRNALKLCGWVIDLQTKCNFWVGGEASSVEQVQSELPERVLQMISEAVSRLKDKRSTRKRPRQGSPYLVELQFLACHRVRQLHSIIFEKQRVELSSGQVNDYSRTYVEEATNLAAFAIAAAQQIAEDPSSEDNSCGWRILAETLSAWTPYCDSSHITTFLSWFFNAFSKGGVSSSDCGIEAAVAEVLVKDASFFEIPQIASMYTTAGLSSVTSLVKNVVSIRFLSDETGIDPSNAVDIQAILQSANESTKERTTTLSYEKSFASINQAERILKLLNSTPELSDHTSSSITTSLSIALQIEGDLLSNRSSLDLSPIFKLFCTNRETISRLFKHLVQLIKSQKCKLTNVKAMRTLLTWVMRNSISTLELSLDLEDCDRRHLARSSTDVIESIVQFSASTADGIYELDSALDQTFKSSRKQLDEKQTFALSCAGKAIARVLRQETILQEQLAQILKYLERSIFKSAFHLGFTETKGRLSPPQESSLLCLAECFRLSSKLSGNAGPLEEGHRAKIEEACISKLRRESDGKSVFQGSHSLQYLLASISTTKFGSSFQEILLDMSLESSHTPSTILESALASVTSESSATELAIMLSKIQRIDCTQRQQLTRLRLFRLIVVTNATSEEKVRVIARVAPVFFRNAMQLLCQDSLNDPCYEDYLSTSVSVIIELASRKELISLENCDVALVLGYLTTALQSNHEELGFMFKPVSSGIYKEVFTLLSFLLQRFAKQMYVCVPSIVCTLNALLQHNLFGDLDELDIMDRGQKFSRLCELLIPHKEVYKKHVLGILVEFVCALSSNLDLARKNSLTPAVYFILDMLQQYETNQLNTMLDMTGKTLFRSVYQSYQKLHVYKGQ